MARSVNPKLVCTGGGIVYAFWESEFKGGAGLSGLDLSEEVLEEESLWF